MSTISSRAKTCRALLISALLAGACATQAGTVRYYAEGQVPSPAVVAGILGKAQPAKRMKMRGGAVLDEPAAQAPAQDANDAGRNINDDLLLREQALSASAHAAVQTWHARVSGLGTAGGVQRAPAPSTQASAQSLALAIGFDNDSARLHSTSAQSLAAVAEGMRLAGFSRAFMIEGHTSATGTRAHNQWLSRERAASVKRYLVQQHSIPAAALRTIGLGFSTPLNRADPNAAENRRVQFRSA